MSWINGYVYLIGLITANITLAYTSADFVVGISNVVNVTQITSQGAYVGLFCGLYIMATLFNMLGMKFSGYMNKFMVFWCFIGSIVIICACPGEFN
jgi:amino acid transporter